MVTRIVGGPAYREGVSELTGGFPAPRPAAVRGRTCRGRRIGSAKFFPPGVHIGMPSTALTVIVTIDEPIELLVSRHPAQSVGRWDALASGLTVRPCLIGHHGYQHGVQLAVTPLGARVLFGVPTADLGSWLVDLTVQGRRPAGAVRVLAQAARPARRGLRFPGFHLPRSRGRGLEFRHLRRSHGSGVIIPRGGPGRPRRSRPDCRCGTSFR